MTRRIGIAAALALTSLALPLSRIYPATNSRQERVAGHLALALTAALEGWATNHDPAEVEL